MVIVEVELSCDSLDDVREHDIVLIFPTCKDQMMKLLDTRVDGGVSYSPRNTPGDAWAAWSGGSLQERSEQA